jgi:hypothetical protein
MPTGLKRYNGKGDLHFITFSCYRRMPLLKTAWARNIFGQESPNFSTSIRTLGSDSLLLPTLRSLRLCVNL